MDRSGNVGRRALAVLDRTVQRLKDRNQDLPAEELEALIDEALAEVRKGARSAT